MQRFRTHALLILTLLCALLLLSSCGALRKRPSDVPQELSWIGPEGALANIRILLHPAETTIILDAETVDLLFTAPRLHE